MGKVLHCTLPSWALVCAIEILCVPANATPTDAVRTIDLACHRVDVIGDEHEEVLGFVVDLAREESRLFVLDFQSGLGVADLSTGTFSWVDRQGEGPGRFQRGVAITASFGESPLAVLDTQPPRVTPLALGHEADNLISSLSLSSVLEPSVGIVGGELAGNYLLLRTQVTAPDADLRRRELVKIDLSNLDSRLLQTVDIHWSTREPTFREHEFYGLDHRIALSTLGHSAVAPNYFESEIFIHSADGGASQAIRIPETQLRPRSKAGRERARELLRLWGAGIPSAKFELADSPAAIQGLWYHDDGSLWVWTAVGRFESPSGSGLVLFRIAPDLVVSRYRLTGITFDPLEDRIELVGGLVVVVRNYESAMATMVGGGYAEVVAHTGGPLRLEVYQLGKSD